MRITCFHRSFRILAEAQSQLFHAVLQAEKAEVISGAKPISRRETSPNLRTQFRRLPHRVAGFNPEGIVKRRHIDQRADGSKLAWRMRVHGDEPTRFGIADIGSPDLGERNEKPLLGRKTIDGFALGRIFRQSAFEGIVCDVHTAEVREIFTEGELAIDVQAGQWLESIVFVHHLLRARLELLGVLIRPPAIEITVGVIFPALVVVAVGDFVADDDADRA